MDSLDYALTFVADPTEPCHSSASSSPPRASGAGRRRNKRLIPARHRIFDVGDRADRLYCAAQASVVIYRPIGDGRKTILDIVAPGHWFGFTDYAFHDCVAVSTAASELSDYSLDEILASSTLARRAFADAVKQIDRLRRVASIRLGTTTLERLASFLLVQLPPEGTAPTVASMPLTRAELAEHLATTVETLARNMSAMRRAGVIDKERHGAVEIADLAALREIASGAANFDAAGALRRDLVAA